MSSNPIRDLDLVTRASVSISLRVRKAGVEVSEVLMADLSAFIAACAPFLASFDQLADVKETTEALEKAGGNPRQIADKFGFFKMIADNNGAFLDAAALVCTVDGHVGPVGARAFLARLRPDEFFHIALAVVEVNGDFFILRLAPAIQQFLLGVGRIGLSPSSASSLGDIAAPISPDIATANSSDTLPP